MIRRPSGTMHIPRCAEAFIPFDKLTDYLLSESHPMGKSKARFFHALGFELRDAVKLEALLREIACRNEVVSVVESVFGTKYVVDGILNKLDDIQAIVRTVWIIEVGQDIPRFVTAYPLN